MTTEEFLKKLEAMPVSGWPPDWGLTPVQHFSYDSPQVHYTFWVSGKTQQLYVWWRGTYLVDPGGPIPIRNLSGRIKQRPYEVVFTNMFTGEQETSVPSVAEVVLLDFYSFVQPYIRAIRQHGIESKDKYMKDYS